jgi:CRP-like cAMP-binding protein
MSNHLLQTLLQHRNLSAQDRLLILNSFTQKKIRSGDWLIRSGSIAKCLYFIQKGLLKITVHQLDDTDAAYFFMEEQQFMTILYSMYENVPSEQGLQAVCDSEIFYITYLDLLTLYSKLPYLSGLIDRIAQLSMAKMITIKNTYISGDALKKYSLFLKTQPRVAELVTLKDTASYIGITPQSLSRIRRIYGKL